MSGGFDFWVIVDGGVFGKVFIFPDGRFFEDAGGDGFLTIVMPECFYRHPVGISSGFPTKAFGNDKIEL